MKISGKYVVAGILLIFSGFLAYDSLSNYINPYLSVTSVVRNIDQYRGRRIQVMGVVQSVARKEGMDFILRHEVLLHGPAAMDLTNQVIREYDKRHPGKKKKKGK